MYLCTSIIQYIVTYRHKKLRKFDKKKQAFQGLREILLYSTVKEPGGAMKITEVPPVEVSDEEKDFVMTVAAFGWLQDLESEGYVTKEELRYLADKYGIPVVI